MNQKSLTIIKNFFPQVSIDTFTKQSVTIDNNSIKLLLNQIITIPKSENSTDTLKRLFEEQRFTDIIETDTDLGEEITFNKLKKDFPNFFKNYIFEDLPEHYKISYQNISNLLYEIAAPYWEEHEQTLINSISFLKKIFFKDKKKSFDLQIPSKLKNLKISNKNLKLALTTMFVYSDFAKKNENTTNYDELKIMLLLIGGLIFPTEENIDE